MGDRMGSKAQLRGWERAWLVVFAVFVLVPFDRGPAALTIAVRAAGWLVIVAAVGLAELGMALYYRGKRARATR